MILRKDTWSFRAFSTELYRREFSKGTPLQEKNRVYIVCCLNRNEPEGLLVRKDGDKMTKKKLTKADIIDNIHEINRLSRKDIHKIIDYVFEQIKKGLSEDRIVELRGFGTFEIRLRKGRQKARNPKTGEVFPVQNHGVPVFRPGQELKQIAWPMRH